MMDYNPNYPGLSGLLSDNYLSSLKYIGDVKNNIIRIIILIAQSFSEIIIRTIIKKLGLSKLLRGHYLSFLNTDVENNVTIAIISKKLIFIN